MKYKIYAKKVDGTTEAFSDASTIDEATRKINILSRINLSKKSVDLGYLYFYFLPKKEDKL